MSLRDQYSSETRQCLLPGPFKLESGRTLDAVEIAYRTWGRPNATGDNVVLVCHPLTGSADVDRWWPGVLGVGKALDPERDFIVASNVLGGCYGSTGPAGPLPGKRGGLGPDFPPVTIRDQVRAQGLLLEQIGIRRIDLVVGGSLGGMQALEWAAMRPLPVENVAALAAPARHSAWAIGLSEAQRQAVLMDPCWRGGRYAPGSPPRGGLALARQIAMCSYRSPASFELRFARDLADRDTYQVESYLRHQGLKLAARFDANSYMTLTRAMDSHDLARGRGALEEVLAGLRPRVLIVGIRSDVLYPPDEIERLADSIPHATLAWLDSPHGHDAFLIEQEEVSRLLRHFRGGGESHEGKGALSKADPTTGRSAERTTERPARPTAAHAPGGDAERTGDHPPGRTGERPPAAAARRSPSGADREDTGSELPNLEEVERCA